MRIIITKTYDAVLRDLLAGHDQQQTLQVIRCDLVEDDLDVQGIVQPHWVMPDGTAEDEIVHLLILLQFGGDVEDVLFSCQRHRERIAFHDTIQRIFFHFLLRSNVDDTTDLFDDVLDDRSGFRVDNAFRSTRQPVHLPFGIATGCNGSDLFDAGHVLPAAVAQCFAQILQTNHCSSCEGKKIHKIKSKLRKKLDSIEITVIRPSFIVGGRLQVFEQIRFQYFRATEIGGRDGKESPASLTGIRTGRFVIGRLFHDLTISLVA